MGISIKPSVDGPPVSFDLDDPYVCYLCNGPNEEDSADKVWDRAVSELEYEDYKEVVALIVGPVVRLPCATMVKKVLTSYGAHEVRFRDYLNPSRSMEIIAYAASERLVDEYLYKLLNEFRMREYHSVRSRSFKPIILP